MSIFFILELFAPLYFFALYSHLVLTVSFTNEQSLLRDVTASLRRCVTAALCYCVTALLRYCVTALLRYCVTASLRHFKK